MGLLIYLALFVFFFKQKTAYEMRISDWSSDVCSSDLERKEKVDFTNKYYNTPAKFVRKKGSGIEITEEGLKGKSVGVQRATIHDNFVTEVYGDTVEATRYGTQAEAYHDMVPGRIALLLADSVAMKGGLLDAEPCKDQDFVGREFSDAEYFGTGAATAP